MKRWWASSEASSASDSIPDAEQPQNTNTISSSTSTPPAPSNHESIEKELAAFNPIFASQNASPPQSSTSHSTTSSESLKPSSPFTSTIYPTTMSCREAFDLAMACRGPAGQFKNLYRYGEFRDCSQQWSQFWFCMRTRTKPRAVKEQLIQEWYRDMDEKKYAEGKPSSEDVWEERKERVERAFMGDLMEAHGGEVVLEDTREWRRQFERSRGGERVEK